MCVQDAGMFTEGMRKPFGSTRVEVIVTLFNQIADMVNFPSIAKVLTSFEKACLIFRLGWLAVWNPLRPDGIYTLQLKRREERQLARILIALLVSGPNMQWSSVTYTAPGEALPVAVPSTVVGADEDDDESSWNLPSLWQTENGLPQDGILRMRFRSPQGARFSDKIRFRPDSFHYILLGTVFANPPAVDSTHKRTDAEPTLLKAIQLTEQLGLSLNYGTVYNGE